MNDDHFRVAYVEVYDDETKKTAAEVCKNAVAWFAQRGVSIDRVLSDNGQLLPKQPEARDLRRPDLPPGEDPTLPAAGQRQDRTLPPHLGRGLGLQGGYSSESAQLAALPGWIPVYNHRRPNSAIGKEAPITRLNNLASHHN